MQKLKYGIKKLLTITAATLCVLLPIGTNFVYADVDNSTATGTVTGSGVSALYPGSCKTDQHYVMDMNWTAADTTFTQNVYNFGWLSAAWANSSPYSFSNYGTAMTNAVYYVRVKDLGNIHGETFYLNVGDVNMIIGNNSNSQKTGDMSRTLNYGSVQVLEGSDYYSNYTFTPGSQMIGGGMNNIYGAELYSSVAHNNNYYASTDDILYDLTNHTSSKSTYKSKTPGVVESGDIISYTGGFTDSLPTLYYNPTYDIFEGCATYQHPQVVTLGSGTNAKKLDIQRVVYVRAIFLRGGTTNTWISGLNSPGSLYNPHTGLGSTSHGVVNQLNMYPRLFTNDQYEWTDGGNGEAPTLADGNFVQPNGAAPSRGRIVTKKYPSPLHGTHSMAMLLREYDSYYKGGSDTLNHHYNSCILYINANVIDEDTGIEQFDTYIIFYKDGDYVRVRPKGSKLSLTEGLILTGGNIETYTQHNGTGAISSIDYVDTFGRDLPFGLEEIEFLPHVFAVYGSDGLQADYWTAWESAYSAPSVDETKYYNLYFTIIGFNTNPAITDDYNMNNYYNASDGYTMLDIFWPGASMEESGSINSISIDDYGKREDGGPNVGAYEHVINGDSIWGNESYNTFDPSELGEFASTLTTLDLQLDSYAEDMKAYISEYTGFLQNDYPLLNSSGFMSTAAGMKTWIDSILGMSYISPFVDTVLLILIVMIAIR